MRRKPVDLANKHLVNIPTFNKKQHTAAFSRLSMGSMSPMKWMRQFQAAPFDQWRWNGAVLVLLSFEIQPNPACGTSQILASLSSPRAV